MFEDTYFATSNFCKSPIWNIEDLNGLGLLGFTPCFEDMCLLSLVHILGFLFLISHRIRQIQGKLYSHTHEFLYRQYVKIFLSAGNAALYGLNLILNKKLATFEIIANILGSCSWILMVYLLFKELKSFTRIGQWIPRFCFFWAFVCTAIRWQTQYVLSQMQGSSFYFHLYLTLFASQMLLVCMLYHERGISTAEYDQNRLHEDMEQPISTQILTSITPVLKFFHGSHTNTDTIRTKNGGGYQSIVEDDGSEGHKPSWSASSNPQAEASLWSRVTFAWMSPLLMRGHKYTLEEKDCWRLQGDLRASPNYTHFDLIWNQEKQSQRSKGDKPSLLRALRRAFLWSFFPSIPLLILQNICQLALPYTLGPLIRFLQSEQPAWIGYCYAFGFFSGIILTTFFENQYFDVCSKTGVKTRGALVPAVFRHSMRLSNSARQERSVGAIVNHMSSDVEKIQLQTLSINNLWSSPMRLVMGLVILVHSLGWSGIIGLLTVLLIVPLQTHIMNKLSMSVREVMKRSDARMKLVNEVLGGMRVIKYYAWELPFQKKLETIREDELQKLTITQRMRAFNGFFINLNPALLATATFTAFAFINGNITPSQAFQASAVFQQLLWPLMLFPRALSDYFEALISVGRIEDFLLSQTIEDVTLLGDVKLSKDGWPEKDISYIRIPDAKPAVEIQKASFSWGAKSSSPVNLFDIDLKVQPGSLVAIVGSTGSGKSSLVSAILGDMTMVMGRAKLFGSVAYIPQQAWIFNATVRENITFGLPFNRQLYDAAIDSSQLRSDIETQFNGGDLCEIGEKGINLSGGQRQRINIARGVFADADIYLFDDPLSALDAHVTAAVFRECIKKQLRGKTIILVTNQLHLMPDVDKIIVMKHGRIQEQGTFNGLMSLKGEFHRLYDDLVKEESEKDQDQEVIVAKETPKLVPQLSHRGESFDNKPSALVFSRQASMVGSRLIFKHSSSISESEDSRTPDKRKLERKKSELMKTMKEDKQEQLKKDVGKLITAEGISTGNVQSKVYQGYVSAVGWISFAILMIFFVIGNATQLFTSFWLSYWSKSGPSSNHTVTYYISIYIILSMSNVFLGLISNLVGYEGALRASRVMYQKLSQSLLRAPISFYDSTPLGRITNRFVDLGTVDNTVMMNLMMTLRGFIGLLGTVVVIGITTTYALVPFVPLLALFMALQRFYGSTSVQLKRLEAVSRSPVFAHFTESLSGMSTVRAYVAQSRLSVANILKLDNFQMLNYLNLSSNRWLSIRLEFLGGMLVLVVAINCVMLRHKISAADAGLSLSYVLQITAQLNLMVRFLSMTEADFNSVERVLEYINLESEADALGPEQPPSSWPDRGEVILF